MRHPAASVDVGAGSSATALLAVMRPLPSAKLLNPLLLLLLSPPPTTLTWLLLVWLTWLVMLVFLGVLSRGGEPK